MALNRSNATSTRPPGGGGSRPLPPRLYTPTTPRGQPPPPVLLPRLHIPVQLPRVQTDNLPLSSGDQAARQQSREVHDLSLVTEVSNQLGQLALSPMRTPGTPSTDEEEYILSDENIKVMRKLGEGSVGTVHKIEYVPKRKIMARKLMAVYPDATNHRQIMRELKLLKQCQSPFIVKYYGAYFSEDDDGQSIAICMEYCEGGSLESVYKRVAKLNAHIGEG
ncbi:Protein kinase C signaling pathway involved MAPKK protein, partial [Coemansia sp. S610]